MSQHRLPGLRWSSTEAGPARASKHNLALCPAQPMPPSWGSSEKQLAATCWATQAVPSFPEGTRGRQASGQLMPWAEKHFLPSSPSQHHRAQACSHPSHYSSFRHMETIFWERTGTDGAGCHLKLYVSCRLLAWSTEISVAQALLQFRQRIEWL